MAARLQTERERKALIPQTAPPKSSVLPWAFGALPFAGGVSALGYKAVESFIASRKSDGIVFGVGAVLCLGACIYCVFRVVTSLKTRDIEHIPAAVDDRTVSADRQKLLEINRRLQDLFKPDDEELIELDPPNLDLYVSLECEIKKIETLFPDLREQVAELEEEINRMKEEATPLSPFQFSSPSLDGSRTPRSSDRPDSSFDALVSKLEALTQKVPKYISSASSSRRASAANSPIGKSIPSSSTPVTPTKPKTIRFGSVSDGDRVTLLSPINDDHS